MSSTPAAPGWRREFVERFAIIGRYTAMPPAMTRLLGWLVVCDPPQQTARQLQDGLGLSAGSVSTALGELTRAGLVERLLVPGERTTCYRIRPDGWARMLAGRLRVLAEIRLVADQALLAAGRDADERLREMRAFYDGLEQVLGRLSVDPGGVAATSGSWPSTTSIRSDSAS